MFSFYSHKKQTMLRFDDLYNCWRAYVSDQGDDFHIEFPFCDDLDYFNGGMVSYATLVAEIEAANNEIASMDLDQLYDEILDIEDEMAPLHEIIYQMECLHADNQGRFINHV